MASTSTTELIDDGSGESTLNQFLTPQEQQLMVILSEEEFDRYLQASASRETLQQYLLDPRVPDHAKALFNSMNQTR